MARGFGGGRTSSTSPAASRAAFTTSSRPRAAPHWFHEPYIGAPRNHALPGRYRSRLLHIKGKLNAVAQEVPMEVASLNDGDSFVLATEKQITVWHGSAAGVMEKHKAAALARALADERNGAPRVVVCVAPDDNDFFTALGVKKGPVQPAIKGSDALVSPNVYVTWPVSGARSMPAPRRLTEWGVYFFSGVAASASAR